MSPRKFGSFAIVLTLGLASAFLWWTVKSSPPPESVTALAPAPPARIAPATLSEAAPESLDPTEIAGAAAAEKLRAYLTRHGARADEALLTFQNAAALRRFLNRFQSGAKGLEILGQLGAFLTVRVRVSDYAAFARELGTHGGDYARIANNLLLTPPTPPPAEAREKTVAAPVGTQLLSLLGLTADNARGRGVTIAILDGGVSAASAFGARLQYLDIGYGLVGYGEDAAHATSVAALAASSADDAPGIAPSARVLSIKVTGSDGLADTYSVASGILAALDAGAQVINLSLGAYGDSPLLAAVIEQAVAANVAVVASAGNDQAAQLTWPAAYAGVVSVGATDANGQQAIFSNAGPTLQLTAPGYAITTVGPSDTRVSFSGTSASAPVVAGSIAALLSADPTLTPLAAADLLAAYGNDAGPIGPDPDYGRASLNTGWALARNDPDRSDPAIASLQYDPAQGRISFVIQNRGNTRLTGLTLTTTIGGARSAHPVPNLSPAGLATITISIPSNAMRSDANKLLVFAALDLPANTNDQDPSNNQLAAWLTSP